MTSFGDAEAAVVAILADAAAIGQIGSVTVSTDLVGYSAPARWLRVQRTGGIPTLWMHVDNPILTVEAYAENKATAYGLACAARTAVFAARGTYTGNGLALFDVVDADGLTWKPDEQDPTTARYVFTLSLVTRPA